MARPVFTDSENEAIRNEMIKGALRIFRRDGQDKLTLRNLALQLGLSHTKLYRYFKNKEELIAEVKIAFLEELLAKLTEHDSTNLDPLTRLKNFTEANLNYGRSNPADYKFVFSTDQHEFRNARRLTEVREKIFEMMVEAQQDAIDQGLATGDARTRTHLSWALFHGLISLSADNQLNQGRSIDELIEPAIALLRM